MSFIGAILAFVALIVGLFTGFAYSTRRSGKSPEPADDAPMPTGYRRVLVGYLLVVGVALVYMLTSLSAVEIPEPGLVPESGSGQLVAPSTVTTAPILLEVFPQWTLANPPTVSVALYGKNFSSDSKVRVNMKAPPRVANFVAADLLKFDLRTEDLVGVGSVSLEVVNVDHTTSNTFVVPVVKPRALLNAIGLKVGVTKEVQLLLLVMVAGALGSYVHAIKSLTDFIGNRTLTASWYWWYISRPFLGMAMATIFYAVLRGGFLAGTPADAKVVNPFGVMAIGALVGMFADKAAQKLAEIFDTLFRAEDQRGGKLTAPVIDRVDPTSAAPGSSPPPVLKLIGDRLGKVAAVRLNSDERRPDTVSEKELTLKLRPEDVASPVQIKITAVNPDGGASAAVTFHVTTLSITAPATLPDATAGNGYTAALTASGGSTPYKWSIVAAPAWLKVDEKTGALSGTPTSAGTEKLTVKVADASTATASRTFDLKVNAAAP